MKVVLFTSSDWSLCNYRLPLARRLRDAGHEVLLTSPPGPFVEESNLTHFQYVPVAMTRSGMNPVAELRAIAHLVRIYRRERPDVAHHFTMKGVLYGSVAARLAGVPGIVNTITGRGDMFDRSDAVAHLVRPLLLLWHRLALYKTQVIFQNTDDQRYFEKKKLVRARGSHLIEGSGVDVSVFAASEEPEDTPLVVLPARMLWSKGVETFVEAARMLQQDGIRARFALVGDTDPESWFSVPREQLETWKQEGVVEWWGYCKSMSEVFAQSHICCLPSVSSEGVPRALIEAGACQRALVTTDNRGCREVVSNGKNGLVVPPNDSEALAAALRALLEDAPRRRRMGKRARAIVEQQFSLERVAERTEQVYERARPAPQAP